MKTGLIDSDQFRTAPKFDLGHAHSDVKNGLSMMVVLLGAIFLLFYVLFGRNTETAMNTWYKWVPACLCVLSLPLLGVFIGGKSISSGLSIIDDKSRWIKNAASAQATIIDKRMMSDYDYDEEGYSYAITLPELKLKYTPELAMHNSNEQTIWANVDIRIYEKYEIEDSVHLYYSVTDPSIFLIEGE